LEFVCAKALAARRESREYCALLILSHGITNAEELGHVEESVMVKEERSFPATAEGGGIKLLYLFLKELFSYAITINNHT
jgi:hypothetical protein